MNEEFLQQLMGDEPLMSEDEYLSIQDLPDVGRRHRTAFVRDLMLLVDGGGVTLHRVGETRWCLHTVTAQGHTVRQQFESAAVIGDYLAALAARRRAAMMRRGGS